MRIEELRVRDTPTGRRACATLVAEAGDRAARTLWYEVDGPASRALGADPEGFLAAATAVAVHRGEARVRLEAPVCPALVAGLTEAMRLHGHWDAAHRPVALDVGGAADLRPTTPARASLFLSGGVDSLSLLAADRRTLPRDHPDAFRDALFVFGANTYDFVGDDPDPVRVRAWDEQRVRLERLAVATDLELVAVRTNVRTFFADFHAWAYLGLGPSLFAVAHLLRRRLSRATVAAHGYGAWQRKYGSHPILDACLSSGAVATRCGEPMAMRQEKLATVAAWPEGLAALQVCTMRAPPEAGVAHCGRCEKCLRTMLGLVALGALGRATTFPRRDLTAADLASYSPASDPHRHFSGPLEAGLRAAGRRDLADALAARVARADRRARPLSRWLRRVRRSLRARR